MPNGATGTVGRISSAKLLRNPVAALRYNAARPNELSGCSLVTVEALHTHTHTVLLGSASSAMRTESVFDAD